MPVWPSAIDPVARLSGGTIGDGVIVPRGGAASVQAGASSDRLMNRQYSGTRPACVAFAS